MTLYEKDYFCGGNYPVYEDFPWHEMRVQKAINMLNPKSVLDVGAGYGYVTKRFLEHGIYAMAMDISHWCEEQKIVPNNFIRHDMREIPYPFKDKQFDLIYCEGVLEHIEDDKIEDIFKEFSRIGRRFLLALSFPWHNGVTQDKGHINLHDNWWWFERIPMHSYLALGNTGTQDNIAWMYKG